MAQKPITEEGMCPIHLLQESPCSECLLINSMQDDWLRWLTEETQEITDDPILDGSLDELELIYPELF